MELGGPLHSPSYSREGTYQYPLNRSLVGLHSQSGYFMEEKNLLFLPEFETRTV
jgi:hypothetical protein